MRSTVLNRMIQSRIQTLKSIIRNVLSVILLPIYSNKETYIKKANQFHPLTRRGAKSYSDQIWKYNLRINKVSVISNRGIIGIDLQKSNMKRSTSSLSLSLLDGKHPAKNGAQQDSFFLFLTPFPNSKIRRKIITVAPTFQGRH